MKSNFNFIKNYLNSALNKINKDSLLVILSQVSPGFTQKSISQKKNLFYQVETLIFGQSLSRALYPDRIIVGSSNNRLPNKLTKYYNKFSNKIIVTNYQTAELSKLSINLYLSSTVGITNTINEVSKKIGSNWSDLKEILQLDKRIGKFAYLNPGLGISGGNLERDHINFIKLSEKFNCNSILIKSLIENSTYQKNKFIKFIYSKRSIFDSFLIYGLTYKEGTHSTKNSISLDIISKFEKNKKIYYFDKNIKSNYNNINKKIKFYDFKMNNYYNFQAVVILHTPLYKHLEIIINQLNSNDKYFIFDPFKLINAPKLEKNIDDRSYYTIS